MKNLSKYIVGFIIGVMVALCASLVYLVFTSNYDVTKRVENLELISNLNKQNGKKYENGIFTIQDVISKQGEYINGLQKQIDSLKANTPKDGVDGADGRDGSDGANGKDGYTPIKGIDYNDGVDGKDGADGTTPYIEIKCDTESTYWQVRYLPDSSWEYLNGEKVQCTRKPILGK